MKHHHVLFLPPLPHPPLPCQLVRLQDSPGGSKLPPGAVKVTREGIVLDPNAVEDRRTEAEKRAEAHFLKYEEQRARKAASKSHRCGAGCAGAAVPGAVAQLPLAWLAFQATSAIALSSGNNCRSKARACPQGNCCGKLLSRPGTVMLS